MAEEGIAKGQKERFTSDGYVHYFDCSDIFTDMHAYTYMHIYV